MTPSQQDVDKLLKDPSMAVRREVLTKIADQYNATGKSALRDEERDIVDVIFRTVMKSPDSPMRQILAEKMKDSDKLPDDIVLHLAKDKGDIAAPILQYSPSLKDAALVGIINKTNDEEALVAIASRETLSEKVTEALLAKRQDAVTQAVLQNYGSQISENSYAALLGGRNVSEAVISAVVEKGALSVNVAEKLLLSAEEKVRAALDEKYEIVFESKKLRKDIEKNRKRAMQQMKALSGQTSGKKA